MPSTTASSAAGPRSFADRHPSRSAYDVTRPLEFSAYAEKLGALYSLAWRIEETLERAHPKNAEGQDCLPSLAQAYATHVGSYPPLAEPLHRLGTQIRALLDGLGRRDGQAVIDAASACEGIYRDAVKPAVDRLTCKMSGISDAYPNVQPIVQISYLLEDMQRVGRQMNLHFGTACRL